jgi:hypothetical protein
LIELDYLHQTSSPIKGVPDYTRGQPSAFPYTITVNDPSPSYEDGYAVTLGFQVDERIPDVTVPLLGLEQMVVDFDVVYQNTFRSIRDYGYTVDYALFPERFQLRMDIVASAVRQGLPLDNAPFDSAILA